MMASQFLVKELGISKSCELLGIPRRTYYRLKLHRDRNSRTNTSRIPETVVTKIIELCKEHVT